MTNLILFCDESGTMPVGDRDEPFYAATVACVGTAPILTNRSGLPRDLGNVFSKLQCLPQVVFVRPGNGYGDLLQQKMSKLNTMARASHLLTGANIYLPVGGYNLRDFIWIRCMTVCLVTAVARFARVEAVRTVNVVLDQKSMAEGSRRLFVDRVRSMSDYFGTSDEAIETNTNSLGSARRHIQFGPADISVTWSNELSSPEFEDGLYLAHRLSKLAATAVGSATEAQLACDLGVKADDLFYDVTPDVIRPLPSSVVRRWKNRTGLPEPAG